MGKVRVGNGKRPILPKSFQVTQFCFLVMVQRMKKSIVAVAAFSCASTAEAFLPTTQPLSSSFSSNIALFSCSADSENSSRRQILAGALGTAAALLTASTPASATYSAYTHREQDWEERTANGEIQYLTASDLRNKLREIVPQNTERSRIFCPNGPTAAVSPLMENKCGDRLATPSVYGRTEDVLGNSIPGVASDRFANNGPMGGSSIIEAGGGFPNYGFK